MSALAGAPLAEQGAAPVVGGAVDGQFDRPSRVRSAGVGAWLAGKWLSLKHWLPKGQLLPEHVLRRRHRSICVLLWLQVPALFAFGLLVGKSLERFRLKARIMAASFGLVTCSAVLVDLWNGVTEAHFHFFVMIGVLTLYQDWTPFLVAIGFVVIHHGIGGVVDPRVRR